MAFNALIPTLEVENMDETILFYESNLDFKCINREDNAWALLKKDDVEIMLSSRFYEDKFSKPVFTGGLYIYVDDIDVIWQILKDRVDICYPIENFDYGMREFAIFDNNGYRLQFGQELEPN